MRAQLFVFLSVLCFSAAAHAQTGGDDFIGRKFALVIGNGKYERAALTNPEHDAEDIAEVLRKTGFKVSKQVNADLAAMRLAVAEFESKLPDDAAAFIFYAGHGVQYRGQNYLIPIGALNNIKTSGDLPKHALALSEVAGQIASRRKGVTVIVLDACRDSPFPDVQGIEAGLSRSTGLRLPVDNTSKQKKKSGGLDGVLVAYSTAPDATAADGVGRNSPYTKHLKEFLRRPNTSLESVLKLTRVEVTKETKGRQTPWYESSISGEVFVAGRGRIEFDDLLQVLLLSDDVWHPTYFGHDVISWKEAEPVLNRKDTSEFKDAFGKAVVPGFSRRGSVVIMVGGEPVHFGANESKPAPWNITLIGSRAGVELISIRSSVRPVTGGDGVIFEDSALLQELDNCKRTSEEGAREHRVFEVKSEKTKHWLYMTRLCGASACAIEYFLIFFDYDLTRFGCGAT
jgi:hypothetical protein